MAVHPYLQLVFLIVLFPSIEALYFSLRLVNGTNNSSGRVEVFHAGEWGTVCDNYWEHHAAVVVCRQLGYNDSKALSVGSAYFGAGSGSIWMDQVSCNGSEQSIDECLFTGWGTSHCHHHQDAGVICFEENEDWTDFNIRLKGGSGQNAGNVEVYHAGYWGTIFTDPDRGYGTVNVTCRMLGYSTGQHMNPITVYGSLTDPVWMTGVHCNGTEDSLADCSFDGWGQVDQYCYYLAAVFCYNVTETDFDIRLTGGDGTHVGFVEVYYSGYWGTVCGDTSWGYNDAIVICRMLGYSTGQQTISHEIIIDPVWMTGVDCNGTEDSLADCSFDGWGQVRHCNYIPAHVFCFNITEKDFAIRLSGGPEPNVGRVDVYYGGYWGNVCGSDNSWDYNDAIVTCRMFGYSSGQQIYQTTRYGNLLDPVWMTGVDCDGTEDSLADCSFNGWGQVDRCTTFPACVFCYNTTGEDFNIRLVGGPEPNLGRVEVFYSGYWGGVCGNHWDDKDANVTCRMLGYSTGHQINRYETLTYPVWMTGVDCNGTEDSLADCSFDGWSQVGYCSSYLACVFCYNITEQDIDIRLSGGSDPIVGHVEVYNSGYWGGVCGNYWDDRDANVTCGMLGYSAGLQLCHTTRYGSRAYPVWMTDVDCNGTEDSLADCSFEVWGQVGDCSYYLAIVLCYNNTANSAVDVRLVDGPYNHTGRVEVFYSGYWGGICNQNYNFDDRDAAVV